MNKNEKKNIKTHHEIILNIYISVNLRSILSTKSILALRAHNLLWDMLHTS